MEYNREAELKQRFNEFLCSLTNQKEDYFSKLEVKDFENLKTALKDINNIITYKTTIKFIEWLGLNFNLNEIDYKEAVNKAIHTKPNDNGYDVQIDGTRKVIAEVKCNKPINQGKVFGSAQRNGIEKDLEALLYGKSKVKDIDYGDFYKFLVIYDFGIKVREAVDHFIKNLKPELKDRVFLFKSEVPVSKDNVYVVFIN